MTDNPQCFSEHMVIEVGQFHAVSTENQQLDRCISEILELLGPNAPALTPPFSLLDFSNNREVIYQKEYLDPVERYESKLSTEEVMRVAAFNFIQLSPSTVGDPTMLGLPFGVSLSHLMCNELKDVELATFLLAVAEKVNMQEYDRASNLLHQCYSLSSKYGNPVHRIVYYFSEALQERIDRETGRFLPKGSDELRTLAAQGVVKHGHVNHMIHLIMHCTLPFSQILQFTSIQAILDSIASATRIHMIDLSILDGLQWPILMQALATRTSYQIDMQKISAIVSSEEEVAATGKRLSSFAASLNQPFEFRSVIVPDMKDLREDMFKLKEEEAVGVYSSLNMSSLIVKPESLENLMEVIQNLMPCVVTVIDVEAKHNSKSFINRFNEALFYFSALFDCLNDLMESNDVNRIMLEGIVYAEVIRNIITTQGNERVARHVGISVWRDFFARFGLVEAELSEWSLYQCSLLLKQFPRGDSCTMEKNGKSLLIGWKGTPMNFVSAWKFRGKIN